jgi:polygalacturonase
MKKTIKSLLIVIITISFSSADAQDYYNVLKYGAKNDSSKLATTAIKNAIDAAVKKGGGYHIFPCR